VPAVMLEGSPSAKPKINCLFVELTVEIVSAPQTLMLKLMMLFLESV